MGTLNQNPNSGPASSHHDQGLDRLFSAFQASAASRASADAVDPFPPSIARHRPLETDFFRELSLFNAHFSSESDERSRWAQFLPEHLRPGKLGTYLKETDEPDLFGDSFWWVDHENSGQDCDRRASVNERKMPVVKTLQNKLQAGSSNARRESGCTAKKNEEKKKAGSIGARRESGCTPKKNEADRKSFKPGSQTKDHILYSRDQLLQLRKVKFVNEAILKTKQEMEAELFGVTRTMEDGATSVSRRGKRKESGSTSKEMKQDNKAANTAVDEEPEVGDKTLQEVSRMGKRKESGSTSQEIKQDNKAANTAVEEEPEVGDKTLQEGSSKKRNRGMSEASKANRKMKKRKKRAEMNRKNGVHRLKIEPIQKPKVVSHCRHYINGRCYEGEACKFSHDVVPLTKSKPCSHFSRQSCMKGDDCPYDHQLSKYPCNNYATSGQCSRGEKCLFSHEITPKLDSVSTTDIIKKPETKSFKPANSPDSIQIIKTPSFLGPGKDTAGNGPSPGNFSFGTFANRMQANLSQKSPLVSNIGTPTSSGTSKGTPASANETPRPPKGVTFFGIGSPKPNDSYGVASQKTSNDVLTSEGKPSASKVTDIFKFGKSSSDNSLVTSSAGDKQNSVDTNPKPNVVPFTFPTLTKPVNPFSSRLENSQGKNTNRFGQRSLLSTLGFATKVDSGATKNPT